jgi:cell division septation protein DedD
VPAGNGKRGGSDRVLESRHLVGLFLGVVLLCGVFFTLGYVMGRTQLGPPVTLRASAASREPAIPSTAKPDPMERTPPAANSEWDFYSKDKNPNRIEHQNSPPSISGTPAAPSPHGSASPRITAENAPPAPGTKTVVANPSDLRRFAPPRIPHGAIVVQVGALGKETDALALADAVQQKHFPSFVVMPTSDTLYRVQVGPYNDAASAQAAQQSLEKAGFNSILKR